MKPRYVQLLFLHHSEIVGCEHHAYRHIEFIFPLHFPKDFDIDGAEKITIFYGTPLPLRGWYLACERPCPISELHFPDFDPAKIQASSEAERELIATGLIRDGLIKLCEHLSVDPQPIRDSAQRTIDSGFRHGWIHKKTSKSTKDRKLRIETHLTMRKGGVDAEFVFLRSKKVIQRVTYPTEQFYDDVWFDLWSVEWVGDTALIKNRVGGDVMRFTVGKGDEIEGGGL